MPPVIMNLTGFRLQEKARFFWHPPQKKADGTEVTHEPIIM